ncbi:MAG TPA: GNAT family N-acetyltransferase [Actinomycetota bacterium]|jgi:GNAT superfamily N-acetyltransferase|nr:GNAT family N-acetyltransferase [Actinomycetota bacterium]
MARIEVRPARPGDGGDLARNWIEMGSHYAALDPDAFQAPAADGLTGWFEELLRQPRDDDSIWLVAEVDGRVVGTVDAHLERPADDAARQILRDLARLRLTVDALGVEEAYRRQGVGTRLLRAVEAWGRDRGAARIVLTTFVDSPTSMPFYQHRMGYQQRSVVFGKYLD